MKHLFECMSGETFLRSNFFSLNRTRSESEQYECVINSTLWNFSINRKRQRSGCSVLRCVFISHSMSHCQHDLQFWGRTHLTILDLTIMTRLFLITEAEAETQHSRWSYVERWAALRGGGFPFTNTWAGWAAQQLHRLTQILKNDSAAEASHRTVERDVPEEAARLPICWEDRGTRR